MKNCGTKWLPFFRRTKLILTGVIPVLVPWMTIIIPQFIPDPMTRYFLFTKGWIAWTLIEYSVHRWYFHNNVIERIGENCTARRGLPLHRHGVGFKVWHRVTGVFAIIFCFISLVKAPALFTYVAGMISGAAGYVLMPWLLGKQFLAIIFPGLIRLHLWHQCKYANMCFGITCIIWDRIFKTIPAEFSRLPDNLVKSFHKQTRIEEETIAFISNISLPPGSSVPNIA